MKKTPIFPIGYIVGDVIQLHDNLFEMTVLSKGEYGNIQYDSKELDIYYGKFNAFYESLNLQSQAYIDQEVRAFVKKALR
ncbi:hypothetical protein ACFQ9Y_16895 [Peribacillus simplex]|uniref:hypothetical protein n=1 Tax=Peribacillus simplex TaxID=1478 RepID=UPI00366BFBAA